MNDPVGNRVFRDAPLRVLLLEDSRFDAELLRECLRAAYSRATLEVVSDEQGFVDRLVRGGLDVILSDYKLPGFTGANALQHARDATPDTPFIFVSGVIGEDNAVEMLKQGATDYVSKGRLARLPVVMERALREVSDRQARGLAEMRLREADSLFARVIDSLRDHAVILLDREGTIKTWNRAARLVFGFPSGGPIGTSVAVLYTPENRTAGVCEHHLRTALANGKANHSGWMVRDDGMQFWAEGELTPLYDDAGTHSGYSKIVSDATRAHRDAELLRVARDTAESANHAKDRFLAVLSHELRTPLASIASAAYVLERHASIPEKFQKLLPMIRRNVALEARLIDDLLDLTSIASDTTRLKLQVVDLHRLVRNVAEMVEHDTRAKGLTVDLDLRAANPFVEADPVRMQQVLLNIASNAIKFTPAGGNISVRTESNAADVILTCADNGIGIDSAALPRIFTAFEQGDGSIAQRFGGLGLAIARRIVDEHGGRLSVASEGRDRGAMFTLALAAANAVAQTSQASPASPADSAHSQTSGDALRLLLVEDNADAANAMVLSLEGYGYLVTHASTLAGALEAIDAIGANSFDIVVTDLGLPDGSGIDVGRALGGSVPVIAISSYGAEPDVARTTNAGFAAHLVKPVAPETVHATVQVALAARRPRAAA